jgi:hypothetical protein
MVCASCLTSRSAWSQASPTIAVTVTGRHQVVEGLPTNNAVFVQLGISEGQKPDTGIREVSAKYLPISVESAESPASYDDVPLDPLERDEVAATVTHQNESRRHRDELTQSEEADETSTQFVLSSSFVQKTIDAALATQGIHATLGRLESLTNRSRSSALLPEVRFRIGRDVDQSLRLAPTAEDPYRYTQTGGVSYVVEGAATFRLNRLLFASEELSVERLRLAQNRERQRITELVFDELLVWQKAYLGVTSASANVRRARLRLKESALRLDVLTGGWFSEHEPVVSQGTPTTSTEPDKSPRANGLATPVTPVVDPGIRGKSRITTKLPSPTWAQRGRRVELSGAWSVEETGERRL